MLHKLFNTLIILIQLYIYYIHAFCSVTPEDLCSTPLHNSEDYHNAPTRPQA